MLGLAVAFVIGAAATKLVTALVNDRVMPIITAVVFLIVKRVMKEEATQKL